MYQRIGRGKPVETDNLDVERAKEYPIGEMMLTKRTGASGGREYYICSLHSEKTGSFVWYKEKNRWRCFGCGEYGDSVDLHMKLNNVDFIHAVKALT